METGFGLCHGRAPGLQLLSSDSSFALTQGELAKHERILMSAPNPLILKMGCTHYGEEYRDSLKKLRLELVYDPAISFLGICPEKTIIRKDTCTPMFIAALFTIAKTWKQLKCPSMDQWIRKM